MYADEAKETGLVSDTYESQEEMLAAANELAKVIASKSPVAIYGLKAVMNILETTALAKVLNIMLYGAVQC